MEVFYFGAFFKTKNQTVAAHVTSYNQRTYWVINTTFYICLWFCCKVRARERSGTTHGMDFDVLREGFGGAAVA